MKLRNIIAGALALAMSVSFAFAQTNQGSSPLTIAKGGTNAVNAPAARTSLGLAVGTNVEAWNTNLDCLAALATTGVIQRTGSGTCAALTQAQLTALISLATTSLSGALPAWPNNTTTFFRGDGTYATLNFAALSGVATGAQLPTPGVASLGGVFSKSCVAGGQFIQTINTDGTANCVTPAGGGNVSNVGTPTSGQIAQWTGATTIQGFSPAPTTNSLGADVLLNNIGTYFDGPSIAQGTSGTWWASGTVTLQDSAVAAIPCKLWDGTTVIASVNGFISVANSNNAVTLSGFISSPAGNIRISCKDATNTTGKILFNTTGNSKDSTISAHRIQ